MSSYTNFKQKDKNKFDRNEPAIYNPLNRDSDEKNVIKKHLHKFAEFCAFIRWMPDYFYDLLTPSEGKKLELDIDQRVMMRLLARFVQNYFCLPRGSSKTFIEVMVLYHCAITHPYITLSISASTKEQAAKIWKEKHEEILQFYPSLADEIKQATFTRDTGRVEFANGSVIDNLANAQSSKGLRRRRGSIEESALIDKDLYDDVVLPIFNVPRTTMSGEVDPAELNGAVNRFSTTGYRNSDEFEKSKQMMREMNDCKGSFVYGSDWFLPVHFGRQKVSVVNQARKENVVRFRQNYLQDWIGASDGALLNISKLIKSRTLTLPELSCPKDKNGHFDICEYVIAVDVARSSSKSNNKTAIVVLKIIRNAQGVIRQVQVVNIITPPNGLNYEEQSVIVKRTFYKYGGSLDANKSRVKAVVVDANTIGQGLVEKLLEDVTDPETNLELGCWATINTDDKPTDPEAPKLVYALKSTGINGDIIRTFLNYVESNKLKLVKTFDEVLEDNLPKSMDKLECEAACLQTTMFIDEVSNLRLKKTQTTITVEQVIRKIDKDRWSALSYALFYISLFLERDAKNDDYEFGFFFN